MSGIDWWVGWAVKILLGYILYLMFINLPPWLNIVCLLLAILIPSVIYAIIHRDEL